MADNVVLDPGTGGATIHTDELTAGTYQMGCSKIIFGTSGNNDAYWSAGAGAVGTGVGRVTLASDDPAVALLTTIETNTDFGAAVGGGTEAAALRVTLANDSTGVVTVDGTVTANPASGTIDTVTTVGTVATCNLAAETTKVIGTVNISAAQTIAAVTDITNTVTVDGTGTFAVQATLDAETTKVIGTVNISAAQTIAATNAGIFTVQEDGAALTALQLIDNSIFVENAPFGTDTGSVTMAGAIRDDTLGALTPVEGDAVPLRVNSTGALHVTGAGGGTQYTLGTDTYTETTSVGTIAGAVRSDAGGTLVNTDNEVTALQVDAAGALRVTGGGGGTEYTEDAAAAANPVGGALIVIREDARAGSLTTTDGDNVALRGNNSGELYTIDTDANALLTTIDSDTSFIRNSYGIAGTAGTSVNTVQGIAGMVPVVVDLGANNDVTVTSGTITAVTDMTNPITANPASGTIDTVTTVTTCNLAAETTKVIGTVNIAAAQTIAVTATALDTRALTNADVVTAELSATDNAVLDSIVTNTTGLAGTVSGTELQVDIVGALPAGTAAIGKLAANSGVDIGDVDVTSIAAGSNLIGDVGIQGRTTGGLSIFYDNDLDETAVVVKAGAGTLYSLHVINTTAAPLYLQLFNVAQGSVTVGTTTPTVQFVIPANADSDGAGFTLSVPQGIAFGTAITAAASTGSETAGAPGANACHCNLFYK